ncbi:MAG: 1-acyl-sn-glycerol-3-phosphate acyltransferase [Alphaproteobacteria bacterium]|nr:1-acyl-sn-glycerol-3-phosphate acyltransferase [Alphaproteobacteria bacterium]
MRTFRALAFTVLFYGWTSVLAIVVLPVLLGPPRGVLAYGRFWVRGAFAVLHATVGITHQVRGQHLLPDGPVILAFKHQSAWDTLAINLLAHDPAVVLKKELLRIPIFGWCLARVQHIAVDRKGGSAALRRMVAQTRARVAEGRPIVIYPEGTRTKPGTRHAYHPGIAALYGALDLPVVPVALNSGLFWPRRSLQMHPGTITVEYLPAIAPGLDRKTFMHNLETAIETTSEKLHKEALTQFFREKSTTRTDSAPGCG